MKTSQKTINVKCTHIWGELLECVRQDLEAQPASLLDVRKARGSVLAAARSHAVHVHGTHVALPADLVIKVTKPVIAARFALLVHSHLMKESDGQEKWAQIAIRNAGETSKRVCHSHDFCDANMLMELAIDDVLGSSGGDGDESTRLWVQSWDFAREHFLPNVALAKEIIQGFTELGDVSPSKRKALDPTNMVQQRGALDLIREMDQYLREVRSEGLDGSEAALGELLASSTAFLQEHGGGQAMHLVKTSEIEAVRVAIISLRDSASSDGCDKPYAVVDATAIDGLVDAALPILKKVDPNVSFTPLVEPDDDAPTERET